jgi:hypothetical protein
MSDDDAPFPSRWRRVDKQVLGSENCRKSGPKVRHAPINLFQELIRDM